MEKEKMLLKIDVVNTNEVREETNTIRSESLRNMGRDRDKVKAIYLCK